LTIWHKPGGRLRAGRSARLGLLAHRAANGGQLQAGQAGEQDAFAKMVARSAAARLWPGAKTARGGSRQLDATHVHRTLHLKPGVSLDAATVGRIWIHCHAYAGLSARRYGLDPDRAVAPRRPCVTSALAGLSAGRLFFGYGARIGSWNSPYALARAAAGAGVRSTR